MPTYLEHKCPSEGPKRTVTHNTVGSEGWEPFIDDSLIPHQLCYWKSCPPVAELKSTKQYLPRLICKAVSRQKQWQLHESVKLTAVCHFDLNIPHSFRGGQSFTTCVIFVLHIVAFNYLRQHQVTMIISLAWQTEVGWNIAAMERTE